MRLSAPLLLLSLVFCAAAQAQDVRYVSDKQFVPLRSGAGNEFRIVHRGIPSGTRMTVARTSDDGDWSEITTDRGTSGWIRTQYLMSEVPAAQKVSSATARATEAVEKSTALASEVEVLQAERTELLDQINNTGSNLDTVSDELAQLKQISGKSVQLDIDNRRLAEESENLRSDVEMLKAENLRLQDKVRSEDYLDGALAVLLGVIITLVVPRLAPKRRRNSEWA